MIKDIFASLISITKGLHRDKRTDREFRDLVCNQNVKMQYKEAPLFMIEFPERALGDKRKYYKNLIDQEANKKFNEIISSFPASATEPEHIFNYKRLFNQHHSNLERVKSYIDKYEHSRESIRNEDTFIIQYLKANMIWLYLELQERFGKYGDEDILTTEEIYQYHFNEVLDELEIKPSEIGKTAIKERTVEPAFNAIESDLPHRHPKDKVLAYKDIVQHSKSLARAEEMMFEADIIDKDYNFIPNTKHKNKSVLGVLYFLFIEKDYFNKITTDPFKRIKSTDIVRFLNHRYNTDARKQFKTFENNDAERNDLISAEYILKNLPNKIR
jgi:hypothetical protein